MTDRMTRTKTERLAAGVVERHTLTRRVCPPGARAAASVTALLVVLVASGCTGAKQWYSNGFKVGPNYRRPLAPVSEAWIDAADDRVIDELAVDDWWRQLNDPTLDGLVETAYQQNLDLQTAGVRILEVRAQRNIAAGNLFPQSQTALGTYVRGQIPKNPGLPFPNELNLFATGFNASWEADFWGRYRRTIPAGQAKLDASVDGYHDTLVMLLADVAASYVQYRTF